MNLASTSLLNGFAVLIKVATTLLLNKLLAVYVGASGYALIGQFQNLVSLVSALSGGALNVGVIKLTAQYGLEHDRQLAVWRTAATIGVAGSLIGSVLLLLAREPLARFVLNDSHYAPAIACLAAALVLIVLNGLMLAILNGLKAIRPFVICQIAGSLISATLAGVFVLGFGLFGALAAMALGQAAAFFVTLWVFRQQVRVRWLDIFNRIEPESARKLSAFALMSLTSAVVAPVTQLLIRNQVALELGWDVAGLWQALNKLSEMHLMLLTTTLSVYLLPRLAEIRDAAALRAEIAQSMRFVVILVGGTAMLLFLSREAIIAALLTREFLPLADAMGMQLVGDVLKMGSWVLAYTMISHGRTRTYLVTEVAFGVLLTVLSIVLTRPFGLLGAAYGYAATYLVYLLAMYFVYRDVLRSLPSVPALAPTSIEHVL